MEALRVPNWQVFSFKFIKMPFFSSFWFSALVYTIWNPSETLPTVLGIIFLVLSFTKARFFMAILSPLPLIATVILSFSVYIPSYRIGIIVLAVIWMIFYSIAMMVWKRIANEKYVLSPATRVLIYNPRDFIMPKGKGKR